MRFYTKAVALAMNPAGDYGRILRNISLFLSNAQKCSPLIDVLPGGHYNDFMEELRVQRYIRTDQADSKRRWIHSEGALAALLLCGALGVIVAGNALSVRLDVPRAYLQLPLYAALALLGWAAYRRCLTSFRYTLTDCELIVERVVGWRVRPGECAALSEIERIVPFAKLDRPVGGLRKLSARRKRDSLAIVMYAERRARVLLISPGEEFIEELMAQWTNART